MVTIPLATNAWVCSSKLRASIHTELQFGEDRCTQFRVIVVINPPTHPPTNPARPLETDRTDYNTLRRSLARSVINMEVSYSISVVYWNTTASQWLSANYAEHPWLNLSASGLVTVTWSAHWLITAMLMRSCCYRHVGRLMEWQALSESPNVIGICAPAAPPIC